MKPTENTLPMGYVLQGEAGQYTIRRKLGQGAFGITYMADTQVQLHGNMGSGTVTAQVAIKEFFMHELNSRNEQTSHVNDLTGNSLVQKYRSSFIREANHMAALSKKNPSHIVQVIEVFEANNTAYIVMQYINGGSLDDYIRKCGKLPEPQAFPIFRQVCDAIAFMHRNKMLHLDLKPKNIMLNENGLVQMIDFGLSKQYSETGEAESSTSVGLGTPGYAPNEQSENHSKGTFPVTLDIYALGATLFKMLTGKTPPLASSVLNDDELLPAELRECGVSEETITLVVKAMMPASRKRYQSVEELMRDLPEDRTAAVEPSIKPGSKDDAVDIGDEVSVVSMGKQPNPVWKKWGIAAAAVVLIGLGCLVIPTFVGGGTPDAAGLVADSASVDPVPTAVPEEAAESDIEPQVQTAEASAADAVAVEEVAAKEQTPKERPAATPKETKKTIDIGYATWTGEVKDGKPNGSGTMTYKEAKAIGDESNTTAEPGDVIEGQFQNGRWSGFPRLHRKSTGKVQTLAM